ncbi:hypothetical protein C4588_06825 [Candidatus Parcubacteria bacterium]|nr:MAG: hypothetical protein C4588_06825 [Candidatus Parcubacteria bacterium]
MVEIVSKPEEGWHYDWSCDAKGCHSKLRAAISDVNVDSFGGNAWEKGEYKYYVTCPVCGTQHRIKDEEVPPLARTAAWAKRPSFD